MSTTGLIASFGSGLLIAKGSAAPSQPIIFGALQDIQLNIDRKIESLMGQNQFPILSAAGSASIKGTAKAGQVSGPLYSSLVLGVTPATGTVQIAYAEAHSVPAVTTYTITVNNSATFVADQGVVYAATGIPLVPVASGPTQGQYSVSAGVYTFAAADASAAVQISYTYSSTTAGSTITFGNPLQGVQPVFSLIVQRSFNGTGERFLLPNCIAGKLSLPTSMAKWAISQFDFEAFAGSNGGNPMTIYTDV